MWRIVWIWCISLTCLVQGQLENGGSEDQVRKFTSAEHRLKQYLMKDYDVDIFPTRNSSDTLKVKFGLAAISLVDVHEQNQELAMKTWLRYLWKDSRLSWNVSEFENIKTLRISNDLVWKPDITLYNGNDDAMHSPNHAYVVISSNGEVLWIPQRILRSSCQFDLRDFPYDKHICSLKFGSWTFDGFKLDLNFYNEMKEMDLVDYVAHHEYIVLNTTAVRNMKYYPCCIEPYPDLVFYINISRLPGFYVHFFVSPAVVMFLLMPFIFLLRQGSSRSTVLGIGVMVCATLLITQVMDPTLANKAPTIMIYYSTIFILTGICLFLTFLIDLLWTNPGVSSPPRPLNKLVASLGFIFCVTLEDFKESSLSDTAEQKVDVRAEKRAQWKALAVAISRVLFVISLVVNVVTTMALFA